MAWHFLLIDQLVRFQNFTLFGRFLLISEMKEGYGALMYDYGKVNQLLSLVIFQMTIHNPHCG